VNIDERCLFLLGDTREQMRRLPPGEIACCVTSPPYFGLRDYGVEGQIGIEPTPEAFVASMVEVFREVKRVLRPDGTLWVNLGDSYAGGGGFSPNSPSNLNGSKQVTSKGSIRGAVGVPNGLKTKDLIGIPWMVAFALRNDGWYLRQDIVWHKPNPMPESVTDRCTKAHEYLFLLTKSERYCFDAEAIREPCSEDMQRRAARGHTRGARGRVDASRQDADTLRGEQAKIIDTSNGRNKRSVWTVPTHPYKGAHFATFPPALIEPCILAGSRPGDVVLDPFGGAGTTALVSLQHGRDSVYIDLNPEYERIARARLAGAFPDAS
jgi:DNA modification methylase